MALKFVMSGGRNSGYTWSLCNGRHTVASNCRKNFKSKAECEKAIISLIDDIVCLCDILDRSDDYQLILDRSDN